MPYIKPLFSYDATDYFEYDIDLKKQRISAGPVTKEVRNSSPKGTQALKDWNRLTRNIWIMMPSKEVKSLHEIINTFTEKNCNKYALAVGEDNKFTFTNIQGLSQFIEDTLFHKVLNKEVKEKLVESALVNFHQAGLCFAATIKVLPQLAETRPDFYMTIPSSLEVIFIPTDTGIECTEIATYNTALVPTKMLEDSIPTQITADNSFFNLKCKTSLAVAAETTDVKIKVHKLEINICDSELRDFAFGYGYIRTYIKEYSKQNIKYHPDDSPKKAMLDLLMDKISDLYRRGKQDKKLISLFYIYEEFKNLNLSNENSIKSYYKVMQQRLKSLEVFKGGWFGKTGAWISQGIFQTGYINTMSDTQLLIFKLQDFIEKNAFPQDKRCYEA